MSTDDETCKDVEPQIVKCKVFTVCVNGLLTQYVKSLQFALNKIWFVSQTVRNANCKVTLHFVLGQSYLSNAICKVTF